jgi:putative ABC transport system ATP-binding protein
MDGPPIIKVHEVSRHFFMGEETVKALDCVSLEIKQGEFFGISGPSGSGKSTLLYLLGGLDRPTAGSIWIEGKDIASLDENELASYRRKSVGFIFQSFHLVPTMTSLQNVELPMIFSRMDPKERRKRAIELLELIGLEKRLSHRPTELSGGQRQRVAIARALSNSPLILIADEPTGNLDSRNGEEVICLLRRLCEEEGITIVIVSHDPNVIQSTHRYIRMHDGHIVEEVFA